MNVELCYRGSCGTALGLENCADVLVTDEGHRAEVCFWRRDRRLDGWVRYNRDLGEPVDGDPFYLCVSAGGAVLIERTETLDYRPQECAEPGCGEVAFIDL